MSPIVAVVLYSTLLPLGLTLFYYVTRSKWNSTVIGRIIVGLLLALIALLIVGLINFALSPVWIFYLRLFVYSVLHVGAWHFFVELRRIQRTRCDGTVEPSDLRRAWEAATKRRKRKGE